MCVLNQRKKVRFNFIASLFRHPLRSKCKPSRNSWLLHRLMIRVIPISKRQSASEMADQSSNPLAREGMLTYCYLRLYVALSSGQIFFNKEGKCIRCVDDLLLFINGEDKDSKPSDAMKGLKVLSGKETDENGSSMVTLDAKNRAFREEMPK